MQDLQLVLIGIGGLAIVGLIAHGVWASKRESKNRDRYLEKANESSNENTDEAIDEKMDETVLDQMDLDDDPLFDTSTKITDTRSQPQAAQSQDHQPQASQSQESIATDEQAETEQPFIKVHKSPMALEQAQQKANEAAQAYEQSRIETEAELDQQAEQKLQEQRLAEEQARLAAEQARIEAEKAAEPNPVIFYVKPSSEGAFDGQALVACMRKYGLSFGKNDIFHSYENGDPQQTLFSIANMEAPGTFPTSPMADFETKGILLFLLLLGDQNTEQHFKRMLLTAQQIADDLGGHVLDDKKNLMTPNRLDQYRQQIRESISPQA